MKKMISVLLAAMLLSASALAEVSTPTDLLPETSPVTTEAPAVEPTAAPTEVPAVEPTAAPTEVPTVEPTAAPTEVPTAEPTAVPTEVPTAAPTEVPTVEPTAAPTEVPTAEPTAAPTEVPTVEPTAVPTEVPAVEPTAAPTEVPAEELEDADKVGSIYDLLDPNRRIDIYVRWNSEERKLGAEAKLIAVLHGYEQAEYTLQWQYSTDDRHWENIPGATGSTYTLTVTKDNYLNYWRVLVVMDEVQK